MRGNQETRGNTETRQGKAAIALAFVAAVVFALGLGRWLVVCEDGHGEHIEFAHLGACAHGDHQQTAASATGCCAHEHHGESVATGHDEDVDGLIAPAGCHDQSLGDLDAVREAAGKRLDRPQAGDDRPTERGQPSTGALPPAAGLDWRTGAGSGMPPRALVDAPPRRSRRLCELRSVVLHL